MEDTHPFDAEITEEVVKAGSTSETKKLLTPRIPVLDLQPSVSSHTGERSSRLSTAGRMRARISAAETENIPIEWRLMLIEMWVQFPGQEGPIWGWFRECAG